MIGTLGQFVKEIRDKLAGSGDPIPVDIGGATVNIDGDVVAEFDDVEAALGLPSDEEATSDVATSSLIGLVKRLLVKTPTLVDGATPVTGPLTDAELRADPLDIAAAGLPLPDGAATEVTLESIDNKIPELVDGAVPVIPAVDLGAGVTSNATTRVVFASDQTAIPVTDASGSITVDSPELTSIDDKLPALVDGKIPVDIGSVSFDNIEIKNDSGNPVPVVPAGVIDAGNGYSGTLTGDQVFTGTGIEASPGYGTISVCIFSSHASASNGLKFQASIDNVNWETIEEYTYSAVNKLESYSFAPSGRYFRVVYTNGATVTTKTVIFTVLRTGYTKSSSHRIGDAISGEKDAELVKAVLAAMKPNGEFTDIHCTAGGNLKVSVEETEGSLPVTSSVAARTPTTTSVTSSASSVTILAANANRRGVSIFNDSTATLRLSFSTPATAENAFIGLPAGAFLLLDQQLIVTGAIYGIWASANGTAQITEYV